LILMNIDECVNNIVYAENYSVFVRRKGQSKG